MGVRRARHGTWGIVAGTAWALGVVSTVAVWGLWVPVAVWFAVAVAAFTVATVATKRVRTSARIANRCGLLAVGCTGPVAAFGWPGAVVVLTIAVTCPFARIMLRIGTSSAGAGGVLGLDDPALCNAWRSSYVCLQASRDADAWLEVVRLRQLYLDELARRHPVEVRHWLAAGARAGSNPLPYISRPQGEHRTAEGDRPDGRGSTAA